MHFLLGFLWPRRWSLGQLAAVWLCGVALGAAALALPHDTHWARVGDAAFVVAGVVVFLLPASWLYDRLRARVEAAEARRRDQP